MDSGVAHKPIADMDAYRQRAARPAQSHDLGADLAYDAARANPKRVLFAEGEEEVVLRAAIAFHDGGYGTPVLVGRDDVYDQLRRSASTIPQSFEVHQQPQLAAGAARSTTSTTGSSGAATCAARCERMVNQDRNIFAAAMLALGEADAMITGTHPPLQPDAAPGPHA